MPLTCMKTAGLSIRTSNLQGRTCAPVEYGQMSERLDVAGRRAGRRRLVAGGLPRRFALV